jgi:hypothetical protein
MVAGGRSERSEARQGKAWLVGLQRTWFAMSLFRLVGREGNAEVVLIVSITCTLLCFGCFVCFVYDELARWSGVIMGKTVVQMGKCYPCCTEVASRIAEHPQVQRAPRYALTTRAIARLHVNAQAMVEIE